MNRRLRGLFFFTAPLVYAAYSGAPALAGPAITNIASQVKDGAYQSLEIRRMASGGLLTFVKIKSHVTGVYSDMGRVFCYKGVLEGIEISVTGMMNIETDFNTGKISFAEPSPGDQDRFSKMHPGIPLTKFPLGLLDPRGAWNVKNKETTRRVRELF